MGIRDILPSTQFALVVGAIAMSVGFVVAAYFITNPPETYTAEIASVGNPTPSEDWQKTLKDIQDRSPLNKAPQGPSKDKVQELLNAATSDNLTDTVARTLFINLSAAKAQGLGNDIPTQDSLIAEAINKINQTRPSAKYSTQEIITTVNTNESLKAYGNDILKVVQKYPEANYGYAVYLIATSTDNYDLEMLSKLTPVDDAYASLGNDLIKISVPSNFAPFHLKIANNFIRMAGALEDVQSVYKDPLKGLSGLELFDALNKENLGLFINIAQNLNQHGIIFTEDEPGYAWSSLVP